jgi:predicted RNase H-like nuclease (RuvC/YqgF family)
MIRQRILSTVIIICVLVLTGCRSQAKKRSGNVQLENKKQELSARQMEQAQEMQLAAIKVQDENVALKAKIEELTEQLKTLQTEFDTYKKKMAQPENWEEKYKKLQAENEELRKLVQYERGLRDDLLKKVKEDQATINELKSKLNE